MDIQKLLTEQKEKVQAAEEIRARAAEAGSWQGDDEAKFDALMDEAEQAKTQIERLRRFESLERSVADFEKPGERRTTPRIESTTPQARRAAGKPTNEDRSIAIQAWAMQGDATARITERHLEAAQRCGIDINRGVAVVAVGTDGAVESRAERVAALGRARDPGGRGVARRWRVEHGAG